jgi:hypothetical protein
MSLLESEEDEIRWRADFEAHIAAWKLHVVEEAPTKEELEDWSFPITLYSRLFSFGMPACQKASLRFGLGLPN